MEIWEKPGDAHVHRDFLTNRQLDTAPVYQQNLLIVVLTVTLALAYVPDTHAGNDSIFHSGSVELKVSATVLPFAVLNVSNRFHSLPITEMDISRGYLDVSPGSSIEVRSNSREGLFLIFECMDSVVKQVQVDGLGKPVVFDKGSTIVHMMMDAGRAGIELNYRFILSEDAQPGVYPWPLQIGLRF